MLITCSWETVDRFILRPELQDSPRSVSTGGTPLRKISKVVAPRDTKQFIGTTFGPRNLTESLTLFFTIFSYSTNYFSTPRGGYLKTKKSFILSDLSWWTGRD